MGTPLGPPGPRTGAPALPPITPPPLSHQTHSREVSDPLLTPTLETPELPHPHDFPAPTTTASTATSEAAASPPPPGPPGAPPGYAATQPQMLVLPLPDAPGFFWGRTLQGEVFVKGLGEARTRSVESLTVTARLTDRLPGRPEVEPVQLAPHVLYHTNPAAETNSALRMATASTAQSQSQSQSHPSQDHPFPASHRFAIPLPAALADGTVLPASLDLGAAGSLRWTLRMRLALLSGEVLTEMVNVEGAPPELDVGESDASHDDTANSTEAILERDGVRVRLLLACSRPRLGDPLRIGVEVRPKRPERVTLAGLVAQPDPDESLRPLRRVRVELVRLVDTAPPDSSSTSVAHTYTSVVHASGKSLRYPGSNQPPLRVLFTLSTAPLHPGPLASGGEISARTPYHTVRFVVRATLGFGSIGDATGPGTTDPARDWCVEEPVVIRPPIWHEPQTAVIEGGVVPVPGHGDPAAVDSAESAREAYRRKGQDMVGAEGTTRVGAEESDLPPPFTDEAGPSGTGQGPPSDTGSEPLSIQGNATTSTPPPAADGALPTFTESEAQMRSGQAPTLSHDVASHLLQPVTFDDPFPIPVASPRRGSLTGELGTWVEYDGYERFSDPPPPAAASYGVESSMDPPRDGDDENDVVGSIAARLGLPSGLMRHDANPEELMEQLGLGQGTRVVDLQDDLPPGIDEPSLPALPGFGSSSRTAPPQPPQHQPQQRQQAQNQQRQPAPQHHAFGVHHEHPPSFDASEAAEAVGAAARSRVGSVTGPAIVAQIDHGDAPPGYFGGGPPAYS